MSKTELSVAEKQTLVACEADIEKGATLMCVAIAKIRDGKLYRGEYGTFEDYMRLRWNKSRCQGIKAANHGEVVLNLTAENVRNPNISEHAAEVIHDLPPAEQAKVVEAVVKDGKKPTAKAVAEAKEELTSKGKISGGVTFNTAEIEAADEAEEQAKPAMKDCLGREVPEHLREQCSNAQKISHVCKDIGDAATLVRKLKGEPGAEFVSVDAFSQPLTALRKELSSQRYWTACPRCDGSGCQFCDKAGWLPESRKGTLSAEDKAKVGI